MQWVCINDRCERVAIRALTQAARHDAKVLAQRDIPLSCYDDINGSCSKTHNENGRIYYVKMHCEEKDCIQFTM